MTKCDRPQTKEATIKTQPWTVSVKTTVNPPITAPAGATPVSTFTKPVDVSSVIEPIEAPVKVKEEHAHIYDNFPAANSGKEKDCKEEKKN